MRYFISDRCDLTYCRLKSLFRILCITEVVPGFLPNVLCEKQIRQLGEIEVIDNAKRVSTCRPSSRGAP
jgi:hypothetical protein